MDYYPEFTLNPMMSWDGFLSEFSLEATMKTAYDHLDPGLLADGFELIECCDKLKDTRVHAVFMNAHNYVDVRKFGRDIILPVDRREDLEKGYLCQIWGSMIIVNVRVPVNTILFVSEESVKKAATLLLHEAVTPAAKELIACVDAIHEISGQVQSLCARATKVLHDTINVVERKQSN